MNDETLSWSLLATPGPLGMESLPPLVRPSEAVDWNVVGPGIRAIQRALERPLRRALLPPTSGDPIAPSLPPGALAAAVARLPAERVLHRRGDVLVLVTHGDEAPDLLLELGRLREMAFRAVGEGTGRSLDLDPWDRHYDHLIAWDQSAGCVLGAYRIGRVDRILAQRGAQGMYLDSLFQFAPALWERLGPSLELGRAFVTPLHQRTALALSDLWQGIGHYLVRSPEARHLLGAVSIDRHYPALALNLMIGHLRARHSASRLVPLIRPRTPLAAATDLERSLRSCGAAIPDLRTLDELVSRLDPWQRGVPVLFRSYMGLGARVLGVNVDPAFQDSVDALVLVDLDRTEPRRLRRFMGRSGYGRWSAFPERGGLQASGLATA